MRPRIHVGPAGHPGVPRLEAGVERGGGEVVGAEQANGVVWLGASPDELQRLLSPQVVWVQLPGAGVERWIDAGVIDDRRWFTSAGPAYADTVAEHASSLILASAKGLARHARSTTWQRSGIIVLRESSTLIVGCGRIGRSLIRLLQPLGSRVYAVNRSGRPVEGAETTVPVERLDELLPLADFVVLAAPATDESRCLIGRPELQLMSATATLINVGRGSLVDTEALVEALQSQSIGGAALDVTDPEPLPDDHPLWHDERALITPHIANTPERVEIDLCELVVRNTRRLVDGVALDGLIDPSHGY